MQKFKIHRKTLNSLCEKEDFITKYDDRLLPEFLILEGELLEDGTVEKCCEKCFDENHWAQRINKVTNDGFPLSHYCKNKQCCCHNKKEECPACVNKGAFHLFGCKNEFNRETPKEEVKLPEAKLTLAGGKVTITVNVQQET